MLNILNTKSRLGWNEVTVSITKEKLITPQRHEDNVYSYQNTGCPPKSERLVRSPTCVRSTSGSGFIMDAEKLGNETLNLCFERGFLSLLLGQRSIVWDHNLYVKPLLTRFTSVFSWLCLEKSAMCDSVCSLQDFC